MHHMPMIRVSEIEIFNQQDVGPVSMVSVIFSTSITENSIGHRSRELPYYIGASYI